jgi:hypothetical protein
VPVADRRRKLSPSKHACANRLDEVNMRRERPGRPFVRAQANRAISGGPASTERLDGVRRGSSGSTEVNTSWSIIQQIGEIPILGAGDLGPII